MIILVVGRPDSGKSELAERLLIENSSDKNRIYLATMEVLDEEGAKRVLKHRKMREGKGFKTIECSVNIDSLDIDEGDCVLLECISNLVGNEMYLDTNRSKTFDELLELCVGEVRRLAAKAQNIVIVTNEFELDSESYDEETRRYVRLIHEVNQRLALCAEKIYQL